MRQAFVSLIVLCLAMPAMAQSLTEDRLEAGQTATLASARPFAVVNVQGAFGRPDEILGVYQYWDFTRPDDTTRNFAVRRQTADGVSWAVTSDCPGLRDAVAAMEHVPPPVIDVMGIGLEYGNGPMLDGIDYQLWVMFPQWENAIGSTLQFGGNMNTPLAAWVESLRTTAEACWSDNEPEVRYRR